MGKEQETDRNDNPAGNVHIYSVKAKSGNRQTGKDVAVVEAG